MRLPGSSLCVELVLRLAMALIFLYMERMSPFSRQIHPDEMWLYRNPRRESYVGTAALWSLALLAPLLMAIAHFALARDREDLLQTLLGVSLALGINCILTDMVKLIVGRPRPDFFWRCFPDGELNPELQCSGPSSDVAEGRKSFPSGHSSISFCSLGFMSWWCMGKLRVWSGQRGRGALLVLSLSPLAVALAVALSRTCDYHHHWQDVVVGSMMGLAVSYLCYRQHFPALSAPHCQRPLPRGPPAPPPSPLVPPQDLSPGHKGQQVLDAKAPVRSRNVRSYENVARMRENRESKNFDLEK